MPDKVQLIDGRIVDQGGPEDRATWLTCSCCGFTGPLVGYASDGAFACMGSCGGVRANPLMPKTPTTERGEA